MKSKGNIPNKQPNTIPKALVVSLFCHTGDQLTNKQGVFLKRGEK